MMISGPYEESYLQMDRTHVEMGNLLFQYFWMAREWLAGQSLLPFQNFALTPSSHKYYCGTFFVLGQWNLPLPDRNIENRSKFWFQTKKQRYPFVYINLKRSHKKWVHWWNWSLDLWMYLNEFSNSLQQISCSKYTYDIFLCGFWSVEIFLQSNKIE